MIPPLVTSILIVLFLGLGRAASASYSTAGEVHHHLHSQSPQNSVWEDDAFQIEPHQGLQSTIQPDLPSLSVKNFASTLRYVGEINRRLTHSAKLWGVNRPSRETELSKAASVITSQPENVAKALSIFHAKEPRRDQERRGSARWGPNLETFLAFLVTKWNLKETDLGVAAVYLDRSCSVETPRTDVPPCPFIQPRTVHRLVLTASLIAAEARLGVPAFELADRIADTLGISLDTIDKMVCWMKAALGHQGLIIQQEEVWTAGRLWDMHFPPLSEDVTTEEGPFDLEDSTLPSSIPTASSVREQGVTHHTTKEELEESPQPGIYKIHA